MNDRGKLLYNKFVESEREFMDYIKPIATKEFNERLKVLNKKYYRFQYIKNINSYSDTNKSNTELKNLYRKLCLQFHPDKFIKNSYIFVLIAKLYENNEQKSLEYIDKLSSYILNSDSDTLNFILPIISDNTQLEKLYNFIKNKDNDIHNFKPDVQCFENNERDMFSNTHIYQWYMGSSDAKKMYESFYYDDDELMENLKFSNSDELNFYFNIGSDAIKIFIIKKLQTENDKLNEEIARLKEII